MCFSCSFKVKTLVISDSQSLLCGPLVVREIVQVVRESPSKSIICASRCSKIFQVVRTSEKFGNHCYEASCCSFFLPKPDEDVDLLVDNVERKNAEGVVFLDLTGGAELVERALRHPRKDVDHWIKSVLLKKLSFEFK